jgi:alkylated DNA repair dioxygenase AlkB
MMLFPESTPHTVLDGELGSVRYFPAAVPQALAQRWFEQLCVEVPWGAFRRQMYDREVNVPRLVSVYDLDASELPAAIRAARAVVQDVSAHVFNSVGLNRYRDGNDSVAPHNDRLDDLTEGAPIALLSLGATRRLVLHTKNMPRRRLDLDLESGSVLVMSYATQLHLNHGVPKTREAVGERISLAFRDRPRGDDRPRRRSAYYPADNTSR